MDNLDIDTELYDVTDHGQVGQSHERDSSLIAAEQRMYEFLRHMHYISERSHSETDLQAPAGYMMREDESVRQPAYA